MSRPVLFDVDPGCDDAAMLALALASDELEVVGVTTVAGNAGLPETTHNALAVLEMFDRADVPVVPGCDRPLVAPLETAEDVHGVGGLPGERPEPDTRPSTEHAVDFVLDRSRTVDDLTVVATGPVTNVAVALAVDPALADRLDELRVMGGAFAVPGNATDAAEFNFYADPDAAARVVRDAGPRLVGLDVTERARLVPETIESLLAGPDRARTIAGWLAYSTPGRLDRDGVGEPRPLHDPLVLIDLLGDVLEYETASLAVEHGTGAGRGALDRADAERTGGRPANVATDVDIGAFRALTTRLLDAFR